MRISMLRLAPQCFAFTSFKIMFEELLVIVLLFWLQSRAARRWWASELRRLHYTLIETQQQILLHASLTMSRWLLQGGRCTEHFFKISLAGMVRSSKAIFLSLMRHFSIWLAKLDLPKREFLRELLSLCGNWEPTLKYRTLSHLFGVGLSTVCCIVHQVCNTIVRIFGPRYVQIPQEKICKLLWIDSFNAGNFHNVQEQ